MTDLVEFLLARIAEDERAIRYASVNAHRPTLHLDENGYVVMDPARALAECEAKRRIVEWHKAWPVLVETPPTFDQMTSTTLRMSRQIAWLTEQKYREAFGTEPPTGPVLRLLALPYADHEDYREEWRP